VTEETSLISAHMTAKDNTTSDHTPLLYYSYITKDTSLTTAHMATKDTTTWKGKMD
jgi:hypothetical protein